MLRLTRAVERKKRNNNPKSQEVSHGIGVEGSTPPRPRVHLSFVPSVPPGVYPSSCVSSVGAFVDRPTSGVSQSVFAQLLPRSITCRASHATMVPVYDLVQTYAWSRAGHRVLRHTSHTPTLHEGSLSTWF
jgi:hypothetical protein